MASKYLIASNATAGDRLSPALSGALQLSTGDLVELAHDPSVADPNSITLQLVPGPAHTAPAVIATLSVGATGTFLGTAGPQTLVLARDPSDNLYVIGVSPTSGSIATQGFRKGAGLTWTTAAATKTALASGAVNCLAAVWCATGGGTGGAGHLFVVASTPTWASQPVSLDAGKVLAGTVQATPAGVGAGNTGAAAVGGGLLDISPDGFGAASGVYTSPLTANSANPINWSISTTGAVGGGNGVCNVAAATLTATMKLRLVRFAPGRWAAVVPSITNAGQLTVAEVGAFSGAFTNTKVDTGVAGNFPLCGATLSWDVIAPPPTAADVAAGSAGRIWILAWSSATPTTLLALPITFPGDVATLGAAVVIDTVVGTAPTTLRTVKQPVDFFHADIQAFQSTTAFSLLGDFTKLPVAPNMATLTAPANNAALPLATGGTFSWLFTSPEPGDAQTSYYLRRYNVAAATYQWWTGAAWTAAQAGATGGLEVAVASAALSVIFGAGFWTTGTAYTWSVQTVGGSGELSGYSPAWNVTALAAPPTPNLTAFYDPVLNQMHLAFWPQDATAQVGSIEYSDDGGVTWNFVRGATAIACPYPGGVNVFDVEQSSQATRQYRAQVWTPAGSYSLYQLVNPGVSLAPHGGTNPLTSYWLKDPIGGVSIAVLIKPATEDRTVDDPSTVHYPLGSQYALKISEATARGRQRTVVFATSNPADREALDKLLDLERPLFYQSPTSSPVWIQRVTSDTVDVPPDITERRYSTYYEHTALFITVARPAP